MFIEKKLSNYNEKNIWIRMKKRYYNIDKCKYDNIVIRWKKLVINFTI